MNKLTIPLVLLFFSCNVNTVNIPEPENPDALLSIQVDSHFDNNHAYLELDNFPLLNETITTNYVLNIAWLKNQMLESGEHKIKFELPSLSKEKSYTFSLYDTLTVIIFFRDSIYFKEYPGYFWRD